RAAGAPHVRRRNRPTGPVGRLGPAGPNLAHPIRPGEYAAAACSRASPPVDRGIPTASWTFRRSPDGHAEHVVVLTADQDLLAEDTLEPEAQMLVQSDVAQVRVQRRQIDLVQVQ